MQESKDIIDFESISEYLDKISELPGCNDWDELCDMLVEVYDYTEKAKSSEDVFFNPLQFLFRLYHRLKYIDPGTEFDQVYNSTHLEKNEIIPCIRIVNYSFKTYMWARNKGFNDYISNGFLEIECRQLDEKTAKHFLDKAKN